MVPLVPPDLRDLPALVATPDPMVSPATLDLPLSLNPSFPATPARKETPAHRDCPEMVATPVPMVNPATPDPKDPLDLPAPLDLPVKMVNLVPVVPPAPRENVVSAPNTALWTEAFSSRMAPADKLFRQSISDVVVVLSLLEIPLFLLGVRRSFLF
jgi:hypothetical protein